MVRVIPSSPYSLYTERRATVQEIQKLTLISAFVLSCNPPGGESVSLNTHYSTQCGLIRLKIVPNRSTISVHCFKYEILDL